MLCAFRSRSTARCRFCIVSASKWAESLREFPVDLAAARGVVREHGLRIGALEAFRDDDPAGLEHLLPGRGLRSFVETHCLGVVRVGAAHQAPHPCPNQRTEALTTWLGAREQSQRRRAKRA